MAIATSEKNYRIGIIGCGGIAHAHAGGYRGADLQIVAAADVNRENLDRFSEQYGIEKRYEDYTEMLKAEGLDIVSVCTWPPLHCEMIVRAAESGAKGILCEKPMCLNLAQADEMIEACDRAHTKLAIGHQRRFTAQYVKAKELIQNGTIGELISVHGCNSGDLLTDGTHNVDLLRFYADDSPILWVMGQVEHGNRERYGHPVEDAAFGYFQFESGVRGMLEVGRISRPGYMKGYIDGTEGRIEVYGDGAPKLRFRGKGESGWQEIECHGENPFKLEILALIACIENNTEHILSGRQGRKALEILMAIFESSRRRGVVHLPLEIREHPLILRML